MNVKKEFDWLDSVCTIVLIKDAEHDMVVGSDPVWHEETKRMVSIHVCKGFINSKEIEVVAEKFRQWTAEEIEKVVSKVEQALKDHLISRKSVEDNNVKIYDKLKELGFIP